jgi:hypothetical protein
MPLPERWKAYRDLPPEVRRQVAKALDREEYTDLLAEGGLQGLNAERLRRAAQQNYPGQK